VAVPLLRAFEAQYRIRVSLVTVPLLPLQRPLLYCRHLIEPRFDEFKSASEKEKMLSSMSISQDISLQPFKQALGSTKLLSAGGYGPDNFAKTISSGASDLVAFGRYFM